MSENKVRKTVSLNKNNPDDLKIIKKIGAKDFNFNEWVRKLMIEDIYRREQPLKIIKKSEGGGIKIVVGR